MYRIALTALLYTSALAGCGTAADSGAPADTGEALWAMDLVRTPPGMQSAYLRSVEANWAGSRELALEGGLILSYLALAAVPDSARGWDVVLLTVESPSSPGASRRGLLESSGNSYTPRRH